MGKDLKSIAKELKDSKNKVQLIYAFNGTGKTRLSNEFKRLINRDHEDSDDEEERVRRILYYNSHTEDLFFWDNDLESGTNPKLNIQPNVFINWILSDQGRDREIIESFQRLTESKINPVFDEYNRSVSFKVSDSGNLITENGEQIVTEKDEPLIVSTNYLQAKISKGEESNFIWSIFYTLLEQVISTLNVAEIDERETSQFDQLEYVFIDDPVSSLDENHLIELAVNLANLIKSAPPEIKFIISTHSPLFYIVIHNELGLKDKRKKNGCYLLERFEDGTYNLNIKYGSANNSFSYHLHIKGLIEKAITENRIEKYHFVLLRNLYEKTASFLGYQKWSELLPKDQELYASRIMNFYSHKTLSSEEVKEPTEPEKQSVKLLLDNLVKNYGFFEPEVKK